MSMNRHQGRRVKEEFIAGAGAAAAADPAPQPMEALHDAGPPPFLNKTYEIVEDPATNDVVSWSRGNNSFVVWDPQNFAMTLLPRYFKHNNFSSFVRQLNTYLIAMVLYNLKHNLKLCEAAQYLCIQLVEYAFKIEIKGFRKVDPDRWEFANEGFLRGQKNLLRNIRRRKGVQPPQSSSHQASFDPCVEVGRFGLDGEVDRLKRDKQVLMVELVKLRQQQQNTKTHLQTMEDRLKRTELKQQQMMNFLARAMQNPNFVQQLVQQKNRRKELEEAICKKRRRRPIEQGQPSDNVNVDDQVDDHDVIVDGIGQISGVSSSSAGIFVKMEPQDYSNMSEFDVEELDELAIDMESLSGVSQKMINTEAEVPVQVDQIGEEQGSSTDKDLIDEGFWKNLLNESMEEGINMDINEEEDEEDVDVLVEQLGYLASSPK
ncbi:Heat shock transcription factor [Trema orientale]|uniref:Heat shock transcription factor n=1 Tax=Trema orientale TaxID=63057 RepID=A0A2P5FWB3_TREOI|nr:Heat shock transcription factor [Trema orientale]